MPRATNSITPKPPQHPSFARPNRLFHEIPLTKQLHEKSTLHPTAPVSPPLVLQPAFERPRLIPPISSSNAAKSTLAKTAARAPLFETEETHEETHELPRFRKPTCSELKFIAAMATFRSIGDGIINSVADRLDLFKIKLQNLSAEAAQKVREAAERAADVGFWALLKKIATCLVAALSIFVGGALISTGASPLVGGAMIGSGLLSITNFTFSEAGIWDWVAKKLAGEDEQRRNQIATLLPTILGISSALIGIFGVTGATMLTGVQWMDKAIFIAQAALATFQGITTLGKGVADSRLTEAKANLSEKSAEITAGRSNVETMNDTLSQFLESTSHMQRSAAQFVQLALRSNELVAKEIHS